MTRQASISKFLEQLRESVLDDSFVNLQLGRPVSAEADVERVEVRLIRLKGKARLSLTSHRARGASTRNLPVEAAIRSVQAWIGSRFGNALLRTARCDWQLHCPVTGRARLIRHKASTRSTPSREHDAARKLALGPSATAWLHAQGIVEADGRVRPSRADKHRQIQRYAEILGHLCRECGWFHPQTPDDPVLRVADVGCGKGYLTFAAWHLFRRAMRRPAVVLGVELRPDLVTEANRVARQIAAQGLEFIEGDIESVELPTLDALIALHACNTATDRAIRRGIEMRAKLIIVAPCCHQALRPEIDDPTPLVPVLRHGLFKERLAEWLTDALRALFLEWAGYRVKAVEFVASEHTPKNLMLAAIRTGDPFRDPAGKTRILEFKRWSGVNRHALDGLLENSPSAVVKPVNRYP